MNNSRFGEILFQQDSAFGVVTVGKNGMGTRLYINYRDMVCCERSNTERELGQLTAESVPTGSSVLNIGLGLGMTAKALLDHENVERLTIAEINPVVVEAAKVLPGSREVLASNKVKLIVQEGRQFLEETDEVFNAVVVDVEEATIAHSVSLFTLDFFQTIKRRITKDGLLALWIMSNAKAAIKILYNSLKAVFADVKIRNCSRNYQLYASDQAMEIDNSSGFKSVQNVMNSEINTMENPVLVDHIDVHTLFHYPDGQIDPFQIA